MRNYLFIILIGLIILTSCKQGSVSYKIKFTTEDIGVVRTEDTLYTQFGDYITSLTPYKFTSSIWTVGYIDKVWSDPTFNMLQYINQNGAVLPPNDPSRYVDFSANAVVNFNPVIFGDLDADHNTFAADQIDFIYFYFIPYYFYQEVEIPVEYVGLGIDMFQPQGSDSAIIDGNVMKVNHRQMIKKIFPNASINNYMLYIFGNTDSTFVVNPNGETIPTGNDNPVCEPQNTLIVRSNLYERMTFYSPQGAEDVVMNGALSMNTANLIQVYAGVDNIPYTSDDVFVYAPNYWERLTARLDTE